MASSSQRFFLALLVSTSLTPAVARAQGLGEAVTGAVVPHSSSAAADDAFALQVNPAGIAYVDAFQLVGGYAGRYLGPAPRDHVHAGLAAKLFDGLALGASGGVLVVPLGFERPYLYGALTSALALDPMFAFGGTLRTTLDAVPGASPRLALDLGSQLRPLRWLALGASLDNLGAPTFTESSLRGGLALRPFTEWVTLATDVRLTPGTDQVFGAGFYTRGSVDVASTARLHIGGLALTLGGVVENALSSSARTFVVNAGIQLDTSHAGAVVLGGWESTSAFTAGAFARASIERFPSILPPRGRWIAFTLVGDGRLDEAPESFIAELLAPPVHPATILAALNKASVDPSVDGVVLRLKRLSLGWARVAELRDAMVKLREAGKTVVVHFDGGGDAEVFLSSAADRIFLTPSGGLDLDGLHVTLTYFADLLEQLGVRAQAVAAGEFKTAPRVFTNSEPSPEELEVQNGILDLTYSRMLESVAAGRKLSVADVEALIHKGPMTADDALAAGLVDGLAYWDQMEQQLEEVAGKKPHLDDGYLDDLPKTVRWAAEPQIAVVPILGTIVAGRGEPGIFSLLGEETGADDVVDALQRAQEDDDIKAVVLRIDSPGGDALASDLIWHAVMELRQHKPVIASMGDMAASGGYYVAAGAQEIFAEPQTLTGSIGVFTLLFEAKELTGDLGIQAFELSRGGEPPPSLFRPLSDAQRANIEESIDWVYQRFLSSILEGRKMDRDKLVEAAGGRVWTGAKAHELGLVDELGGLAQALDRAQELGDIAGETPEITILTGGEEIFPRLGTAVSMLAGGARDRQQLKTALHALVGDPAALRLLSQGARPLALVPARIHVE